MCAWAAGTYTKGNASTGGWTGDASLGIGIEAGRHDTQDNDFATGINQCINKDGSNAFTGDPNLGGFKPTNIAAGTAAAPAICVGGDVNTGVFGPAADTWAVATNGTERVRVDSSGNVGVGTNAPGYNVDIQSTSGNLGITRFVNSTAGTGIFLIKSRGTTVGSNVIVQNGDVLGSLVFGGATGSTYNQAASIQGYIDDVPGPSNDMPGRLVFATSANASATPVERMRINNAGLVCINTATPQGQFTVKVSNDQDFVVGVDVTGTKHVESKIIYDTGTSFGAAVHVELTAGRYLMRRFVSSAKYKKDIETLDDSYADKLLQLRPVYYRSKSPSDVDWFSTYGLIAEEAAQIDPRLATYRFKDSDYDEKEITLEDGTQSTKKILKQGAIGEAEGVNYNAVLSLAINLIQRQEKRIAALEAKIAELETA